MELQELVTVFEEVLNKEGKEVINEIAEKIHTAFGMRLKGIQIRKCSTIQELFNSLG